MLAPAKNVSRALALYYAVINLWIQALVAPKIGEERAMLQAAVDEAQGDVTGTARLKLYKGGCSVVARRAPRSLYRVDMATFEEDVQEISSPQGDATAVVLPGGLKRIMEFLKDDARTRFNLLVDITAVDYLGRKPRFDVVYHLLSLSAKRRLRIKVRVEESNPEIDSMTSLWGSANWLEREVWDMFGIRFTGHPNLKRILMYEEFQGHPLRKDYPVNKRQPLIGPKN